MTDKRAGRRYRTDGIHRKRAGWPLAVGLLDSIDQLATDRGVSAATIAEDALAHGLALMMVDGALAEVTGGAILSPPRPGDG